jgi:hypothetical protein
MRLKLFLLLMLAIAPLAGARAEDPQTFRDELRKLMPAPPAPPPPDVPHDEEELIAKAKEYCAVNLPTLKDLLRTLAKDGQREFTWHEYNPIRKQLRDGKLSWQGKQPGQIWLEFNSTKEEQIFWVAVFDVLRGEMPGVQFYLDTDYTSAPTPPYHPTMVAITASW